MANYNLTSQKIKDTYEQLVQVSGSALVDGTGSLVDTLDYVTNPTFTAYTSSTATSTSASVADLQTQINALEAGSGSADWDLITGKPAGLVSGSSQVSYTGISDVPSGIVSGAAQLPQIATNQSDITSLTAQTSSYLTSVPSGTVSSSAQTIANVNASSENITLPNTNGNQTFTIQDPSGNNPLIFRGQPDFITTFDNAIVNVGQSDVTNIASLSGSWGILTTNGSNRLRLASRRGNGIIELANDNATMAEFYASGLNAGYADFRVPITGSSATFSGDLIVNGTASFAYIQSVTGSAKIIGDAYIILNNDTPAQRYAGVVVQDSGSTQNTASFEFDGQTNDWFYEYTDDGGATAEFGVVMFGPGYNTKGSHVYPSNNTILKGTGDHHIVDSNISDDGAQVSITGPVSASTYYGDGSNLTGVSPTLTNGSGGNRTIRTVNVTAGSDATADGQGTISIGDAAQALSATTDGVLIGRDAAIRGVRNIGIGYAAGNSIAAQHDYSISIGDRAKAQGDYSIALGSQANPTGDYSLAIELGTTTPNPTGTQTINIGKDINNQNGYSTAIGHNLTNNGTGGNVLIGRSITTSGDYSIGIGEGAQASQQGAVAIGQNANSAGNSVAIGAGATMGSSYGFAGGYNARANNDASIAVGGDVNVSSNQAIAIGTDTTIDASSQGAVSLGQNADIATSTRAVVIGQGAGATGANNAIAIGSGSKVTAANEINIGGVFKYDGSTAITLNSAVSASGNVEVAGQLYSPTFAGSVASSTSSIDFDNGNFATLSLTAGTFLASPSNLKSGTTYTIIISSGSLVSGHGTAWKFSGGTAPTYTNGTDVLTCVSDGANLYATALTDFQ